MERIFITNELLMARLFHVMFDIGSFQNQERQIFVLYAYCWHEFSSSEKLDYQLKLRALETKQQLRAKTGSDLSKNERNQYHTISRALQYNGIAKDIFIGTFLFLVG